jgi:uncharacterized protein (TIGR03067 family)
MRTSALLAVAAGLLVGPGHLRADEDRSDAKALQGTWRVVSQQRAGRATARPNNMLWIVEGETTWLVPGWLAAEQGPEGKKPAGKGEGQASKGGKQSGPPRGLRMTFRLDPGKAPKRIDIDGPKKGLSYGIYKLDGDELTVCMGVSQPSPMYDKQAKADESTRPADISPEAGTVIVLRRVRD